MAYNPYQIDPNQLQNNYQYYGNYAPAVTAPTQAPQAPQQGGFLKNNIGGVTSAVTGAVSMFADFKGMGDAANNINTSAPTQSQDAFGNPDYNLGGFAQQVKAIKPQGATGGEIGGSIAKGASAGAAFGPWGALVGGAIGAIGSLIGGRRRKRKMEEKRKKALANLKASQENYNESAQVAAEQRRSMSMYQDQTNTDARMQNLFNIDPRIV